MEFIHTYTIEILITVMLIAILAGFGCVVCLIVGSIQDRIEQKKLDKRNKAQLLLFMANHVNENDYYQACENLGLCSKSSVTELILGSHYE